MALFASSTQPKAEPEVFE